MIGSKGVISIDSEEPVSKALGLMANNEIHQLPVVKDGLLKGMLILKNVVVKEIDPNSVTAGKLCTPVKSLSGNEPVEEMAADIINSGLRALPIVKNNKPVSVVSESDLLQYVEDNPKLEDIMTECITIESGESIGKAKKIMLEHNISRLPVVDGNDALVGIVDTIDLIKTLTTKNMKSGIYSRSGTTPTDKLGVETIMKAPISADRSDSLKNVINVLKKNDYLVVVDGSEPIGIVSPKDVIELLIKKEQPGVYVQITGYKDETLAMREQVDEEVNKFIQKFGRIFKRSIISLST